jgi:hypothetical protein
MDAVHSLSKESGVIQNHIVEMANKNIEISQGLIALKFTSGLSRHRAPGIASSSLCFEHSEPKRKRAAKVGT